MKPALRFARLTSAPAVAAFCGIAICALVSIPPASAAGYLYIGDIFYPTFSDGFIYRMDTATLDLQTIRDTGGGLRGIALDPVNRNLYWTDVDTRQIFRSALDGSGAAAIISSGLAWPMDIDAFPAADRIAWGDQTLEQIGMAHLDGSGAAPLLSTPFAAGIAFDMVNGRIYWSSAITAEAGEIRRANMDGSGQVVIISNYGRPARIALDVRGGKIYWTDYVNDVVRRANLDGTGRQDLYVVGSNLNPEGIALDLTAGKVYWGQEYASDRDKIMRMNLDGTSPETVLIGSFGLIADMSFTESQAGVSALPVDARPAIASRPNPFSVSSTIRLDLPRGGDGEISVHSADGRRVCTLVTGALPAGTTEIRWLGADDRGRPLAPGVYFYRARVGDRSVTEKVILSR